MLKSLIILASLGLTTSAFAAGENVVIQGCSFVINSYYKDDTPFSADWHHGFNVEGRQGWGMPMVKEGDLKNSYIGQVDLDKEGTKFEVVVSSPGSQKLMVRAVIKKITADKTEVLAIGKGSAQIPYSGEATPITLETEIQSPLIASILETEGALSSPMASQMFPRKTTVYGNSTIFCNAIIK